MSDLLSLLGGVGMFLLGMEVMTAALRDAAGRDLRALLARFTTTPLRGAVTGAAATAVIQSSSATTVMVVGFVGAGLLGMPQALGVVFGANVGTTATGWLVSILGFKLNLDAIALALLLPASLGLLLGHGALARGARVLAGLCLLLVGLSVMQEGAAGLTDRLTPAQLPGASLGGLLALAGLGLAVTVLMQSSSAALALALVMLNSGALSLIQAVAIVLGMNIGTTFTALLASVGGSAAMRQTGLANLLFNIGTFAIAFPLVWLGADRIAALGAARDPMTVLLLCHSGFNLMGVALFLPFTARFAALIARLLPDPAGAPLVVLDARMLRDADAALVTAQSAGDTIAARLFRALGAAMAPAPDYRGLAALGPVDAALDELRAFVQRISLPEGRAQAALAYTDLLHQLDHLSRLRSRARETAHIPTLLADPLMRRPCLAMGAAMRRLADAPTAEPAERLARLAAIVEHRRLRHRRGLMLGEHAGLYALPQVFARTDAMRWFERCLHNAGRVAAYQARARADLPAPPGGDAGQGA